MNTYIVSTVLVKDLKTGEVNILNSLMKLTAANEDEAKGKAFTQVTKDYPQHNINTMISMLLTPNPWQQAIDDELVNAHLGIAKDEITREEAKAELNKLIAWHIDVANYFKSQEQQPEITTKEIDAEFLKECADENGHCVLKNDVTFALGYKCGYRACLASQAQQENQVIRKAFICPACECVYADSPVSHCDCFENHSNTYIEGSIIYTPAPEGDTNG